MLEIEKPTYRPDIDGIRAVAVLGVFTYHLGATSIPGGFTGVDMFFVISGFLITQNLKREISSGTFSLIRFYERRIRRILPALIVVILSTLFAGWFLLMPGSYKSAAESAVYASLGIGNIFFFLHTGYFDAASETQVFLHTWSLGVEEQFYLVWPLFLIWIIKTQRRQRYQAPVIGCLVLAGAMYAHVSVVENPKAAFYLPFARAWELGLGALVIYLPRLEKRSIANTVALIGVTLIAYSLVILDAKVAFPGPNAAYACFGTALVLWPTARPTFVARFLSIRPMVALGLISYSLYLWHWPVLVLFRHYSNGAPLTDAERLAIASTCILLAYLSWRLVEQPFRRTTFSTVRVFGFGVGSILVTCLVGFAILTTQGVYSRIPTEAAAMSSKEVMWAWKCPERLILQGLPEEVCIVGANWRGASQRAVLWGDSHAAHLAPLIDPIARKMGYSVVIYDKCPAMLGKQLRRIEVEPRKQCDKFNPPMIEYLKANNVQSVIFAGYWDVLPLVVEPQSADTASDALTELNAIIASLGKKHFYFLTDIPTYPADVVECALVGRNGLYRRSCPGGTVLDRATFEARSAAFREALAKNPINAEVIDIGKPLCPSNTCISWVGDEFIYRDSNHLRRNLSAETNDRLSQIMGLDRLFPVLAHTTNARSVGP